MKVFCDTSVLVASATRAHEHYARAAAIVRRVLNGSDEGYIAAHGLLETYAVLTRLPVAPRISSAMAYRIIQENFIAPFQIVSLSIKEQEKLLARLAEGGISGGSVYDALQIECAKKAEVDRILTFNAGHFLRMAEDLRDKIAAP